MNVAPLSTGIGIRIIEHRASKSSIKSPKHQSGGREKAAHGPTRARRAVNNYKSAVQLPLRLPVQQRILLSIVPLVLSTHDELV